MECCSCVKEMRALWNPQGFDLFSHLRLLVTTTVDAGWLETTGQSPLAQMSICRMKRPIELRKGDTRKAPFSRRATDIFISRLFQEVV